MLRLGVLKVLQWFMYIINQLLAFTLGYSFAFGWKEDQLKESTHYESSAQIMKIGFRAKFNELKIATKDDFLLFHAKYVHPNYVRRDNITLLGVTSEQAYFAVVPPDVDVHRSDLSPFMYINQFNFALNLVVMPIRSFHRLADEVGDPRAQIVLVSSTGRCGSTLLAQMFENIPKTLVMSEPDAFTAASEEHYSGKTTNEQDAHILRSIMRLQCKDQTKDFDMIVVKTRSACVKQIKKIKTQCQFVKHVFMYRNPRDTICSFAATPLFKMIKSVLRGMAPLPETREYQSINIGALLDTFSFYGMMALMWIANCACYIEYKHEGIDIHPIKYEDLLDHPEATTKGLFSFLDIPREHIPRALTALQKDSQRGSSLGRNQLSKRKRKVQDLDKDKLKEINFVLQESGFDSIEEFQDLPDKQQLKLKAFVDSYSRP